MPPQAWRNGGGQTRELLAWAGHTIAPGHYPWQLRVSLADVTSGGPFSAYPGVQRWFAVVEGTGVQLALPGMVHRVDARSAPLHFDGALPVECLLLGGPTRDLNLMVAAGSGDMRMVRAALPWRSTLPQRGLFTRVAGLWRDDRGRRCKLAAQCLLWMEGVAGSAWEFLPDPHAAAADGQGTGDGPPGWWLAYAPTAEAPAGTGDQ